MGVLDKLPQNTTFAELRELERQRRELKAPQRMGSRSIGTFLISSNNTYDITWPPGDTRQGLVTFTPDDMTFGGALAYNCYALFVHPTTGTNFGSPYYTLGLPVTGDNLQKFQIAMMNLGNADPRRMKIYIEAAGSGTFTTSLI